ncbi:MAG TPA: YncE family protein [Gemmatimonadaceae bacterium]|nr:YncE family protein [Gemmatimonadaceae bacterium]
MTDVATTTGELLVVATEGNALETLDLSTLERTRSVALKPMPHEAAVDLAANRAYVAISYEDGYYNAYEKASHYVQVVDLDTFEVVETIDVSPHWGPHGVALDQSRFTLYVTCESNGGEVIAVDTGTSQVTGSVGVRAHGPHWMTLLPDDSKIYTANKEDEFVTVVDVESMSVTGTISTPHGTEQIASAPDSSRVYVTSQRSPHLYVIDTATDAVERVLELEEASGAIAVTPDGSKVVFTSFNFTYWEDAPQLTQGYVQVLHTDGMTLGPRIPVGRFPLNVTTSLGGELAYVSNYKDHTISVVDLERMVVVDTASTGDGPHGLVVLPR